VFYPLQFILLEQLCNYFSTYPLTIETFTPPWDQISISFWCNQPPYHKCFYIPIVFKFVVAKILLQR